MSASTASSVRSSALPPLPLSVNVSASAAGNVVQALSQAALLIALTHFLEPAAVGQFALGLAISGPILVLASLQLRSVQVSDAAHRNHFSEYLGLRLVTSALALAAIAAAAFAFARSAVAIAVIILVGAARVVESVSDVYCGLMQQHERLERVAISSVLRGTLSLLAFTLALWLDGGLLVALCAMVAANLVVWWIWDLRNARLLAPAELMPRFAAGVLPDLARTALPLGVVGMLLSLNAYAPQYALKLLGGEAELGVFAALVYAALAIRVVINAAGQSAAPRLARLYESGEAAAFRALQTRLLVFGLLVGLATVLIAGVFGRDLLRILFGDAYAAEANLFVSLAAISALMHIVSLQGYAVTASRTFSLQLPVSFLTAAGTVAVAWLLIPRYGLPGAAAAMLAGALIQGVGYAVLLRGALRRIAAPSPERAHVTA